MGNPLGLLLWKQFAMVARVHEMIPVGFTLLGIVDPQPINLALN
jgi:hypothetical protein